MNNQDVSCRMTLNLMMMTAVVSQGRYLRATYSQSESELVQSAAVGRHPVAHVLVHLIRQKAVNFVHEDAGARAPSHRRHPSINTQSDAVSKEVCHSSI